MSSQKMPSARALSPLSLSAGSVSNAFLALLLVFFAVPGLTACGEDSSSEAECAEGQEINPETGRCRLIVDLEPDDTKGEEDASDAESDQGEEDLAEDAPEGDLDGVEDQGEEDVSTDVVADTPADTNADTSNDIADAEDDGDATTEPQLLRFVALGDVGTGSSTQIAVGQSMGTVCTAKGGCEFGLLLGDNFYDSGVDGVMDDLWDDYFVTPYGHLPFPFYAVLGNHDLGGNGLGIDLDFMKGDYQVSYSNLNAQWIMPAKHYTFDYDFVSFVALNTTDIFFDQDALQRSDVNSWNSQLTGDWKIAFGHHPYISNGPHGNAGNYEGIADWVPLSEIPRGDHVKSFMDDLICGNYDLYICGHDHSRQDLEATCGTEFIVSGAGAKTTDLEGNNPAHWESDTEGFLLVEATPTELTIEFYDENGTLEHTRVITKP